MPHNSRGQRVATNKKSGVKKNSMYARALRAGSQSQSPRGKKTGTGAAVGGA